MAQVLKTKVREFTIKLEKNKNGDYVVSIERTTFLMSVIKVIKYRVDEELADAKSLSLNKYLELIREVKDNKDYKI